jgi:hypothetical protein
MPVLTWSILASCTLWLVSAWQAMRNAAGKVDRLPSLMFEIESRLTAFFVRDKLQSYYIRVVAFMTMTEEGHLVRSSTSQPTGLCFLPW